MMGSMQSGIAETTLPTDLWRWDAWQLADAIARGTISSREAVTSCLARIDAENPRINALTHVTRESALRAADEADAQRASNAPCGLLHGVPVTIKCNVDVVGEPTTHGVVAKRDLIAQTHSPVVTNLLKAGAVIVGRTNTPAFSMRWFTDNALHGRTLNPWNDTLTPGGSSGGASAAVAAGMCPVAHGNDLAGSVRYPAYACGVTGLRPTAGRIPSFTPSSGELRTFAAQFFAVQGPIARSVRDLQLSLAAMSAADARDPNWVPAPLTGPAPDAPIKVALVDEFDGLPLDPTVRDALHQAARWLTDAGYVVERAAPPDMREGFDIWMTIAMTEISTGFAHAIEADGDDAARHALRGMQARFGSATLEGYIQGLARRDRLRRRWNGFLEQYPVVLMPTSLDMPFRYGMDQEGDAAMSRILDAQLPLKLIAALNYPGLSVPTGVHEGVPVGVQIVAGAFREDLCLAAGAAIEQRARMPFAF
ncbi:amidase family protein [Paraburkholderia sp.]|uniref:amidase family protein n=1 Tax=Paraburkholderia sp. TaxID=1926495 RepID=UPI0023A50E7F|nr:amidase family protein [Paraburkholderia sp.]MDE1179202.1 amidase family protein [Paraburkholderia sp.]